MTKQPLRRSQRLSKNVSAVQNTEVDNVQPRKATLRSSATTRNTSKVEAPARNKVSQRKRQVAKPATRTKNAASQKFSKETTRNKRSRVFDVEVAERPIKSARRSSRSRSRSRSESVDQNEQSGSSAIIPVTKNPCPDVLECKDFGLQRESFTPCTYIAGISEYDNERQEDVQEVCNYATDIFQRLFHAEVSESVGEARYLISASLSYYIRFVCLQATTRPGLYMDQQPELNSMMRSILIDWIVEVHMKFRLLPETLYLCVNIIDRYLSLVPIQRKRLQLVGVTALLLACKYEEIYPKAYSDGHALYRGLKRYFDYYNRERKHSSLDKQTPLEVFSTAS